MILQELGCHNMESLETRLSSHLVDGVLALDAGSLSRSLSFKNQSKLKAILISHRHFDHIRDLLPLGFTFLENKSQIDIYGMDDTIEHIQKTLMAGNIFPDFTNWPSKKSAPYKMHAINHYEEYEILGYSVKAFPVPHAVPASAFEISDGHATLFYTGDTGEGLSRCWSISNPDVLLTEVTFGNGNLDIAKVSGHLTPSILKKELLHFQKVNNHMPKVIVTHLNPPWETQIREELQHVAEDLQLDISVAKEDDEFQITSNQVEG